MSNLKCVLGQLNSPCGSGIGNAGSVFKLDHVKERENWKFLVNLIVMLKLFYLLIDWYYKILTSSSPLLGVLWSLQLFICFHLGLCCLLLKQPKTIRWSKTQKNLVKLNGIFQGHKALGEPYNAISSWLLHVSVICSVYMHLFAKNITHQFHQIQLEYQLHPGLF